MIGFKYEVGQEVTVRTVGRGKIASLAGTHAGIPFYKLERTDGSTFYSFEQQMWPIPPLELLAEQASV